MKAWRHAGKSEWERRKLTVILVALALYWSLVPFMMKTSSDWIPAFWLNCVNCDCSSFLRLDPGENLEENQGNLLQITERFFQAIIGSSNEFPPQLRSVCHCLYQVSHRLCSHSGFCLLLKCVCPHPCVDAIHSRSLLPPHRRSARALLKSNHTGL